MAVAVSKALQNREHLAVEAGTGVGKTLAYLAPASLWAEANGPSVWVSTYTRALQRQIEQRSIGSTGRTLVIREVRDTLAGLKQALADLDAEDARAAQG